ncbi:MAG: lysoplasmalogenase [Alteromonadaceae bacterium]|nr:lysoplasmalogenase [Alteromonadaceae bacterium]
MTANQSKLYFLLASVFILSTFATAYPFSWFVKILPMLLLILCCLKHKTSIVEKVFIAGLVCSTLGDFLLDYDPVNWFVFGLGSFLFAHLCYLFSLKPFQFKRLGVVLLYVFYGIGILVLLWPVLGELLIPVVVYMVVLLLMGIATLISGKSNVWLVVGGLSFIASDSLLGIDKFYTTIPAGGFFIMITYYFAQYSLVRGFFANDAGTED